MSDENGIHARPLELGDVVGRRVAELGDREFPRRHVVQQLEQDGERIVVALLADREQEHLRVEPAHRPLDVLRLGDANDALEAERMRLVPHRELGLDHDGLRVRAARVEHATQVEERKLGRDANRVRPRPDRRQAVGALRLGRACARRVVHLDDERDAVALGDRLAQLAHEWGS